jgi:enamine deaminase RidA (YjgF/YER057c/UK114 family)
MQVVVSVTVYLTFHDRIADIRMQYFPSNSPASAIVEIANLAMTDLLITIAAVAAVP